MENSKFAFGQEVRTVNDCHRMTVIGISNADQYRYTVELYGGNTITNIAECDLREYGTLAE